MRDEDAAAGACRVGLVVEDRRLLILDTSGGIQRGRLERQLRPLRRLIEQRDDLRGLYMHKKKSTTKKKKSRRQVSQGNTKSSQRGKRGGGQKKRRALRLADI